MNSNRRKFVRINSGSATCVVCLGARKSKGTIIDESISGLRIGNLDLLILIQDQRVAISRHGEVTVGSCRSISRDTDGLFQIGVRRESDNYQSSTTSILLNSFIRFDECDVVCMPLAALPDGQFRIRLLDGNEFSVRRDQLFPITRKEREQGLNNRQTFERLAQAYSLMDGSQDWRNPDNILNYEFGCLADSLVETK